MPEMAQMAMIEKNQKPNALWVSKLKRFHEDLRLIEIARRHEEMPGHQTIAPVRQRSVARMLPTPFQNRPRWSLTISRSSCSDTTHSSHSDDAGNGSPRSSPVYALNSRSTVSPVGVVKSI